MARGAAVLGGLGRPPSATCRRDPARPRGERAARDPGGQEGAEPGSRPRQVGARRDRGQSAPSAQRAGQGWGVRRAGASRQSIPGKAAPDGPGPPPPRPSAAPLAPLPPPSQAFNKLGRRPPTAAQARASQARAGPGPPTVPRLRLCVLHLPPEAPSTASSRRLPLECAGRGRARAPKALPQDSARWCQAGRPPRLLCPRPPCFPARPGHSPSRSPPPRSLRRPRWRS